MAINETGYELTVGPDKNGAHFTVAPGAEYEPPEPPESVPADVEADDPAEEPATPPKTSRKPATPPKTSRKPATPPADIATEPATGDTQKG